METGKVTQLAPGVRRIVADNPSPMTANGTNTYLIGQQDGIVILDPGPNSAEHLSAIQSALAPGESFGAIIITHAHRDHTAGAAPLAAALSLPVLAFGDATSGRSHLMERLRLSGMLGGGEGIDDGFRPDRLVKDGDILPLGTAESLRVIHTPGHMGGHICLGYGSLLFSGDHAMGWASSLISPPDGDMRAYMESLEKLMETRWSLMLPGHGPEVKHPHHRLQALLDHRRSREAEVLAELAQAPGSPKDLAKRIYHDTPPALLGAAERNVLAHLIDLTERKQIRAEGLHGLETNYTYPNF